MSITNRYYKINAKDYFDSTVTADASSLREKFVALVPKGGYILDLGCGSGRDTKAFIDMGYKVTAIDSSEELCILAHEHTGIEVKCTDFMSLNEISCFDGIWACASLLHVSIKNLPLLLAKLRDALVPNGVIYASFKNGDFEGERDGRYYTDMTTERFSQILTNTSDLFIVEQWYSEDVIKSRNTWYNVILRKV